ncbi:MAG TPA: MBL fold metallo-hydrolase [Desulfobacteraceae bacterium]|nr:MBL fold metallo-hydrolase [Desulfobacteraceae bacterium]HPJ66811.1 MBL fold metallo-hydrolase [Desulfobacteraceae bacterium]HPQ27021.1 MBL fold metallo-hydrolase [Desulfobacteraceae bacterium]
MREELIDVSQAIKGFEGFIGSWYIADDKSMIFDVGPPRSARYLIDALDDKGIKKVDYIFLTHIHIDHAGGLAELLAYFPMACAVCHRKGIRHLTDPSDLWLNSKEVLGKTAEAYGMPKPVARNRVIAHDELMIDDVLVLETPGHAAHHLSFCYKDRLFAGEAAGIHLIIKGSEYMRPATPPVYFFESSVRSIEILSKLDDMPIYFPHFGKGESSHRHLRNYLDQLNLWKNEIHNQIHLGTDDIIERCLHEFLDKDVRLKAFDKMTEENKIREKADLELCINGFFKAVSSL